VTTYGNTSLWLWESLENSKEFFSPILTALPVSQFMVCSPSPKDNELEIIIHKRIQIAAKIFLVDLLSSANTSA